MNTTQCDPLGLGDNGEHSYLVVGYREYNVPVQMINRLINEDLQRRHNKVLQCCSTEPDNTYISEIFIPGVDLIHREIAFGKWAIPKLKKELLSLDELLVCKALVSLIDLSFNPERCVEIICHNVIARLGKLVASSAPFIRQKVAILLRCIAQAPYGAKHIAQNNYLLGQILLEINDPEERVRHEFLRTIHELLTSSLVIPELIAAGYLEALSSRLPTEPHEYCLLHIIISLEHVAHIGRQYQEIQIKAGVIESTHELLGAERSHSSDQIRIGLLGILAQLMKHPQGKQRFSEDLCELVVGFVLGELGSAIELHVNSIRLLTFAAVSTATKRLLANSDRLLPLMEQLMLFASHDDKNLQLGSIHLLTVISETKAGRTYMLQDMKRIQQIEDLNGDRADVLGALEILMSVIRWTP